MKEKKERTKAGGRCELGSRVKRICPSSHVPIPRELMGLHIEDNGDW